MPVAPPLIVHVITQLELGGAQLATLAQCQHSQALRPPSYLLCGPGGLLHAEAEASFGPRLRVVPHLQRALHPGADARAVVQLYKILREVGAAHPERPLWVHTHSSKAGILGRLAARSACAARVVHSIHGFGHQPRVMRWPQLWALRGAERLAARATDGFTLDSHANWVQARREGIVTGQPCCVLPCNVDLSPYRDAPTAAAQARLRQELQIPAADAIVLQVGCLKPQKDPLTAVAVAKAVVARRPRTTFLLAGDGTLRPQVERASAALGPRLRLLGWRRDVPALLHLCDLVLLTSLWEGLPQIFGQAMAAGRPVVATNVDGAAEAIKSGTEGLLVPPQDVAGFADAVVALLDDPPRRQAMGAAGRARAGALDAAPMLRGLDAFYARLGGDIGDGDGLRIDRHCA